MSSKALTKLFKLRRALLGLEIELGLNQLSQDEKDLLVCIDDLMDIGGSFRSDLLKKSDILRSLPHSNFHRALNGLLDKGLIKKRENVGRANYVLIGSNPPEVPKK